MLRAVHRLIVLTSLFVALMVGTANAVDIFVGPKIGTLGIGAELGVQLNSHLKLRAIGQGFGHSMDDADFGDVNYDAHLQLLSFGGLVDVHPFGMSPIGSGFRLTGGVLYNANQLKLDAQFAPTESVELGNQTFSGAQLGKLNGFADFNKAAPYLGLGWGTSSSGSGLSVSADLGVLFQGAPKVKLRAEKNPGTPADVAQQIDQEVANEENKIQDDIDWFRYYPVAMIGLTYRF